MPLVAAEAQRVAGLGMTTPREMARLMDLIATGKAVVFEPPPTPSSWISWAT